MAIEILMPALSPTMEEGKLARWLVQEGDAVNVGMVVAEIETDKATMEVEAIDDGKIGKLLVAEGAEGIKVNTPIAVLLEDGEDAAALAQTSVATDENAASQNAAEAPPVEQTSAPEDVADEPSVARRVMQPAAPSGTVEAPATTTFTQQAASTAAVGRRSKDGGSAGRVFASPLARRLAAESGLDLNRVTGTGPRGRIVKKDVVAMAASGGDQTAPSAIGTALAAAPSTVVDRPGSGIAFAAMADDKVLALYDRESYDIVPHDGMRRVIAERLSESKRTIPHFYMTVECVLDELLRARGRMNEAAPKEGPRAYKLSVNDFMIKALALALREVPAANATWTEAGMLQHRHADVGVAVAVEGGLFTPIVRHAELKTLGEISNEMKDLATRARNRRLAPHEYQGGTTSISNLGMYGIKSFDAVINPPHATILAVGAGEQRAVVVNGTIEVATIMSCTLSCDHRVVDGAVGAELLNAFKRFVEDPVRMLV